MPHASFAGLRILSLESRRAREVEKLIRTYNGEPIIVPAMRELLLDSNEECLDFGAKLLAGNFDLVIFMTGVGVRAMLNILGQRYDSAAILAALGAIQLAARGSKPLSVLRELKLPVACITAEPSTWREILTSMETTFGDKLAGMRVAVQEYGATNPELIAELVARCASVTKVPVYQWGLPEDTGPLEGAVTAILDGAIDVVLFMTAVQVIHLFQIAETMGCAERLRLKLQTLVVISVGPTTTEELEHYGLRPDFEPSRPKMGFLVNEAAQYAGKLIAEKRAALLDGGSADQAALGIAMREVIKLHPTSPTLSAERRGIRQVAPSTATMAGFRDSLGPFDMLHEIGNRLASADPLHAVLDRIVAFASSMIPCDSCFIFTREGEKLVLRASMVPHADMVDRLGISIGEGITGWVALHHEPVAIAAKASDDPRFHVFQNLPEDRFEALLSVPIVCMGRVVGVINLQHRDSYVHTPTQIRLLSTLGVLVGAEIERARLEVENSELTTRLETRKIVDRAKGVLQRDLGITEDEAYRTMQRESRQRRKSMRDLAEAILLSSELRQNSAWPQPTSPPVPPGGTYRKVTASD
jgi:uroporphyrinogen-III synthase